MLKQRENGVPHEEDLLKIYVLRELTLKFTLQCKDNIFMINKTIF